MWIWRYLFFSTITHLSLCQFGFNGSHENLACCLTLANLCHYANLSFQCSYPPFFDDIAARLLPVIPLIIYRLIENDATDIADRVLAVYSTFLAFHPLRFTFVRDILAYFYGHLPSKLIVRILNVLGVSTKVDPIYSLSYYGASSCPSWLILY